MKFSYVNLTANITDLGLSFLEICYLNEHRTLSLRMMEKYTKTEEIFDVCADLIEHPLHLKTKTNVSLYYFEGLTDTVTLKENVIKPLLKIII